MTAILQWIYDVFTILTNFIVLISPYAIADVLLKICNLFSIVFIMMVAYVLYDCLASKTRASQLGIDFEIISPKNVKPSQYNHIAQTFEKKSLSTRIYDLSDEYPDVQRDLYSAFLIGHIENDHYNQKQLEQDFPDFYDRMKDFLQQPIETTRLAWYLK